MSTDWVARAVAGVSAIIALTSLIWAVLSWRGTGPVLRFHALAYREVLVIRVFNAGRTADWIEHAVLGGRRGGLTGQDLTQHLGLPLRLEPGEAKRWVIRADDPVVVDRWSSVAGGWLSLWLLSGSMKQHRAEVLPLRDKQPPTVGWRLVPRRSKFMRYLPLVGFPVAVVAAVQGASGLAGTLVTLLSAFVILRWLWSMDADPRFVRRRVERWLLGIACVLSVIELGRASSRPVRTEVPSLDVMAVSAYFVAAVVIAVPGLALQLADGWGELRLRTERVARRLQAKVGRRFGQS